jgi:prepilin-type N-terminal cleavage/methylation domain-containing protein
MFMFLFKKQGKNFNRLFVLGLSSKKYLNISLNNNKRSSSAFTLIELLVVIAIIAIIATLSVLALQSAREKARDAKRIADIKQLKTALELYYNDANGYPPASAFVAGETLSYTDPQSGQVKTYINNIPSAPIPADGDCTSSNNAYTYGSENSSTYTLSYCLGGKSQEVPKGANIATPAQLYGAGSGSGSCTPNCSGKCGGPDGCSGTCPNTCSISQSCENNLCVCNSDLCPVGQTCNNNSCVSGLSVGESLVLASQISGNSLRSVASSDTTQRLVVGGNDYVYTSSDYGVTWVTRDSIGINWWQVASSSNGQMLIAVGGGGYGGTGGYIYTSSDYGENWLQRTSTLQDWSAVTSSYDGQYLAATIGGMGGYIYTSSDFGATWTQRAVNRSWANIVSSASGQYLVATKTNYDYTLYTSSDYGVTWIERTLPSTDGNAINVASSTSGQYLVVNGGSYIYTSSDYGVTWIKGFGPRGWESVEISGDGQYLVAVGTSDQWNTPWHIYNSSDYGATWTRQESELGNMGSNNLVYSTSGKRFVVVGQDNIHVSCSSCLRGTACNPDGTCFNPCGSCSEPMPYCHISTGICGDCFSDSDCTVPGEYCIQGICQSY